MPKTKEAEFSKSGLVAGKTIFVDNYGHEKLVLEVLENTFAYTFVTNVKKYKYLVIWKSFETAKELGWKIVEKLAPMQMTQAELERIVGREVIVKN
jgi:hypothetical protein